MNNSSEMTDVDFIAYLDKVSNVAAIQSYKRSALALLDVKEYDSVLDLGCGPGTDSLELATLVGANGRVIGIDKRSTMIVEACARRTNLPVDYLVGDGYSLPFGNGTFDRCRADRVLHVLKEPRRVLSEMVRVLRAGGHIVVSEPDWETVMIDSPYRILTRKILTFLCDSVPTGWAGRQLPRLFREMNLERVTTTLVPGTLTNFDEANQFLRLEQVVAQAVQAGWIDWLEGFGWLHTLRKADEQGIFLCGMTGLTVHGQKPATQPD